MIETINKDILTVEKGVIVNFVNCFGAHGGLNGAICRKYPEVLKEYLQLVEHHLKHKTEYALLGRSQIIRIGKSALHIANLFTQYDIGMDGRKTEYCAVDHALDNLRTQVMRTHPIYFAYNCGCGLGGGDFSIIERMINTHFQYYDGKVYFCKL